MTTAPSFSNRSSREFDPKQIDMTRLFDRMPPHAIESEMAVLGSIVHDWRVAGDVIQMLRADDFYKPAHAAIFAAEVELYDEHQSIDVVQLKQKLEDKHQLEEIGGLDYLIDVVDSVPSASSVEHYARIVRDKSILRRLIEASGKTIYEAYHADGPVSELLDIAERDLFEIAQQRSKHDADSMRGLLDEIMEQLSNRDDRAVTGLETGYYELDEMTNGLQRGELLILAARPSMGKTALAINIAEYAAVVRQQPVLIFSLEMSKQQLAQRLLCSRSGVDSQKVRRNTLSQDELGSLSNAAGALSDSPIFIDDSPGLSLLEMRAKARRVAANNDLRCIVVDYLQLMNHPGANSREQEVSAISRGIKALAREIDVPVICLSQLNRQSESREGHRPRMSDLRESGSIEQDADVVMMLHREDYYHRGDDNYVPNHESELILAKQRNGPTGTVKLQFHGPTMRFQNPAFHNAQPPGDLPV